MKKYISLVCCLLLFTFIISLSALSYAEYISNNNSPESASQLFADVSASSLEYDAINELRKLGITNGIGNNRFGYGQTLSKAEFVTFLVKLMEWEQIIPQKGSFSDNQNTKKYYFSLIETAVAHGALSKEKKLFKPDAAITNEEAVHMIINSLGYKELASRLTYLNKPFNDVTNHIGTISIAKDIGIITEAAAFNPTGNVLREQAALLLIRMKNAMNAPLKDLNGFYAISSSSQQDKLTDFSTVGFGWSRLSYDPEQAIIVLNTSNKALGYNEFYLPTGFSKRLSTVNESGKSALLMIHAAQDNKMTDPVSGLKIGIPEYVLTHPETYDQLILDIITAVKSLTKENESASFDGVVIDWEGLRGEKLKNYFNNFLKVLNTELDKENKKLFVAVHPLIHPKRSSSSIDGYDYRTIGMYADKVILMAHDYDAKKLTASDMAKGTAVTPLTPIEDVYYALKSITDSQTGVQDKSKIMLQISFDWTVWQKKDGKTVNAIPYSFNLENFLTLLNTNKTVSFHYSEEYENPFVKYIDSKTGYENTVWYEDTRSVMEKVKLARFFGIQGISLWRLGQIPDYQPDNGQSFNMDIWQNLIKELEKY